MQLINHFHIIPISLFFKFITIADSVYHLPLAIRMCNCDKKENKLTNITHKVFVLINKLSHLLLNVFKISLIYQHATLAVSLALTNVSL